MSNASPISILDVHQRALAGRQPGQNVVVVLDSAIEGSEMPKALGEMARHARVVWVTNMAADAARDVVYTKDTIDGIEVLHRQGAFRMAPATEVGRPHLTEDLAAGRAAAALGAVLPFVVAGIAEELSLANHRMKGRIAGHLPQESEEAASLGLPQLIAVAPWKALLDPIAGEALEPDLRRRIDGGLRRARVKFKQWAADTPDDVLRIGLNAPQLPSEHCSDLTFERIGVSVGLDSDGRVSITGGWGAELDGRFTERFMRSVSPTDTLTFVGDGGDALLRQFFEIDEAPAHVVAISRRGDQAVIDDLLDPASELQIVEAGFELTLSRMCEVCAEAALESIEPRASLSPLGIQAPSQQ